MAYDAVHSKAVVLLLLTCFLLLLPLWESLVCNCSMVCCTLLCVDSSFAIILMGKRKLVALLCLSSWCLVVDVWLFLAMPWVWLQFVLVVFPYCTRSLFWSLTSSAPYIRGPNSTPTNWAPTEIWFRRLVSFIESQAECHVFIN